MFLLLHLSRRKDTLQDMLLRLPPEIAAYIFSFLDQRDMCNLSLVCLRWRLIATDPYFWHWHDLNLSEITDSLKETLSIVQQSKFQFLKHLKLGSITFSSSANIINSSADPSGAVSPPRTPRKKNRRGSNGKKYPPATLDPIGLFGQIMACCPKLESLDLSLCHNISNVVLQQITRAACSASIQSLQFSCFMENGNKITDTGIMYLSMYCPALEQLHLPWACEISDIALDHLGRGCRALTSLDLMGNKMITDDGIFDLTRGCSQIKYLNLSGCENVTDEALRHLGNGCPQLLCLQLLSCKKITDRGLQSLAKGCKMLRSLHLYKCQGITDMGIHYIAHSCRQLACLELYICKRITGSLFVHLCSSHLRIAKCAFLDVSLKYLSEGCKELNELDLSGCYSVTDAGIEYLVDGCPALQRLSLYGCDRVTPEMLGFLLLKRPNIEINQQS